MIVELWMCPECGQRNETSVCMACESACKQVTFVDSATVSEMLTSVRYAAHHAATREVAKQMRDIRAGGARPLKLVPAHRVGREDDNVGGLG